MDLWTRILLLLAGLMGACGVAAAAVAAHVGGGATLETAAYFLILHAAAVGGLAALALQLTRGSFPLRLGASALVFGALLFSGDLSSRALLEAKLLGGSAPFGGSLMIAGWLVVAGTALVARRA
ncbi:DUF423 domain-containing protein [Xanthobacter agilis]|uniref:Uncharacterized membrane protein YgdD (TMEM256/DUF423 family) n=1 Tax=Xanthobacter agilis TaxID=47492 RepID=A0ABU0LIL2_XANAG|nr:DUF423 domain-containing protein [Xanthobacter agilis]MDQ0506974.1 uncharacterized membrane protein YgdD (TMEM256/DUF423 family) [Xanthobacter agilis]